MQRKQSHWHYAVSSFSSADSSVTPSSTHLRRGSALYWKKNLKFCGSKKILYLADQNMKPLV